MSVTEALSFEGCNLLRQRIVYSILSGRRIEVSEIRPHDESPGVKGWLLVFSINHHM